MVLLSFFMISVEKRRMKEIIQFHNVSKSYGRKKVIDNVTFGIKAGSFTTLIGCNGAGKSTTLRLMAGLESREGNVTCFGEDPFSSNSKLSSSIFLIHESLPINFPMNLEKFLGFYTEVFPEWNESEFKKHIVARSIDMKANYSELSRGQKMQFALSLALASGAKVLLCDEVTSVLDFDAQFYFLEELKKYCACGGTVVMTTNILSELDHYADHVVLIQSNKILIQAALDEISKRYSIISIPEQSTSLREAVTKIRDREGIFNLYIIENDSDNFITEHQSLALKPKLEDVLLHHLNKSRKEHENLVA